VASFDLLAKYPCVATAHQIIFVPTVSQYNIEENLHVYKRSHTILQKHLHFTLFEVPEVQSCKSYNERLNNSNHRSRLRLNARFNMNIFFDIWMYPSANLRFLGESIIF
jgi:hypothetical protein